MAVFDEAWLAVWWPWLLVWVATAALVVAAVVMAAERRKGPTVSHHGTPIYLDEPAVMDIRETRHGPALSRQVEKRVSKSGRVSGSADLARLRTEIEGGVTREFLEKYVVTDKAISVISIVVNVLEEADEIVEVDLIDQEVVASKALDNAFNGRPPADVALRRIRKPLLILGEFRVFDATEDSVTFHASFGDPDDPDDAPQVEIVCGANGLRTEGSDLPSGTFRCLGYAETWDAGARTLKVRPIAVFR